MMFVYFVSFAKRSYYVIRIDFDFFVYIEYKYMYTIPHGCDFDE